MVSRTSHSEVFLLKGVLRIYSKFTGEHPCRSGISIQLLSNFIEIALRHGCSPVTLLHIFRTLFLRTPLDSCICVYFTISAKHNACPKNGEKETVDNYRPVSVLPIFEKIFEKLLFSFLMDFFGTNNMLSANQSGF